MKKILTPSRVAIAIIVVVLVVDQCIKVWVKTHMHYHESIRFADWAYLCFVENNGMAFGMELFGKLFLTIFRILAIGVITYYLVKVIKQCRVQMGLVVCLSLILAGAAGNIIDCLFYGKIFSESTWMGVAHFVRWGEGYGTLFYGKVVDMFYFPMIDTHWPTWLPLWGGERFIFFSPIFNFADAAISCGIIALMLFYGNQLSGKSRLPKHVETSPNSEQKNEQV